MKTVTRLEEGDLIEIKTGHTVYADVPMHFIYENRKGDFSLTRSDVVVEGDFLHLAGKYVVYKTANDGGGTGHGPHDVYPDGHHVYCERVDDSFVRLDFYQSGYFTAMIEEIETCGRAERKWAFPTDFK